MLHEGIRCERSLGNVTCVFFFLFCWYLAVAAGTERRVSQRGKYFSFAPERKKQQVFRTSRPQSPLAKGQRNIISIKPYNNNVCECFSRPNFFFCLITEFDEHCQSRPRDVIIWARASEYLYIYYFICMPRIVATVS